MSYDPNDPNPEEIPAFQWPAQSQFGKEMRRWDTPKSRGGHRPDGFERFPLMLYKAQPRPDNQRMATQMEEPPRFMYATDAAWTNACQMAEAFGRTCQRTVNNEQEYTRAREQGWCDTQTDALAFHEKLATAVSDAAFYRAQEDAKLSEPAQAEARLVDEAQYEHVPEITPAAVADAKETRRAQARDALARARAAKAAKRKPQPDAA